MSLHAHLFLAISIHVWELSGKCSEQYAQMKTIFSDWSCVFEQEQLWYWIFDIKNTGCLLNFYKQYYVDQYVGAHKAGDQTWFFVRAYIVSSGSWQLPNMCRHAQKRCTFGDTAPLTKIFSKRMKCICNIFYRFLHGLGRWTVFLYTLICIAVQSH